MKYTYELSREMKSLLAGDMTAFRNFYLLTVNEVNFHTALVTQSQATANKLIVRIYKKMFMRLNRLQRPEDTVEWFNGILYNELTEWVNMNCADLLFEEEEGKYHYCPEVPVLADIDTDTMQNEAETANLVTDLIPQLLPIHALTGLAYFYDNLDIQTMCEYLQADSEVINDRIRYATAALAAATVKFGKENRIEVQKVDTHLILLAYVLLFQSVRVPNSEDLYDQIIEAVA